MNTPRELHAFNADPLEGVWLRSGYSIEEDAGRKVVRYQKVFLLLEQLLRCVVLKPTLLHGTEVAYIRRTLDMSQRDLSNLVGVEEQTVSLWERTVHPIARCADILLRKLCVEKKRTVFKGARGTSVVALAELSRGLGRFMYEAEYSHEQWLISLRLMSQKKSSSVQSEATGLRTWATLKHAPYLHISNAKFEVIQPDAQSAAITSFEGTGLEGLSSLVAFKVINQSRAGFANGY